jgi:hypothetical protein
MLRCTGRAGSDAVVHFGNFTRIEEPTWGAGNNLTPYMDAQKFRTPRGIDLLKKRSGGLDHNEKLIRTQCQFQFSTMWTEGA